MSTHDQNLLTYRRNIKRMIFIKSTLNNASPEIMERKNSMSRCLIYTAKMKEIMFMYRRNLKRMIFIKSTLNNASPEIMERKYSMYTYPIYTAKLSIMIRCRQESYLVNSVIRPHIHNLFMKKKNT